MENRLVIARDKRGSEVGEMGEGGQNIKKIKCNFISKKVKAYFLVNVGKQ